MDFRLEQLSSENLTTLFQHAYYNAETVFRKHEDESEAVATVIQVDNNSFLVYPQKHLSSLAYETRFFINGENISEAFIGNTLHSLNRTAIKTEASHSPQGFTLTCAYKHIIPNGFSINTAEIISLFRIFEKSICEYGRQLSAEASKAK